MSLPRYIEIHNEILARITAGEWQKNQRLPAERDLAESFNVSRMTLRQAIQTLVDEGILERKVGSGTYVAEKKISERVLGVTSFTDLMAKSGRVAQTVTVSYKITMASASEVEHLQLDPGDEVLVMERLRLGDDTPILLEQTTLPVKLVNNFTRSDLTESLYATLIQAGIQPGHADQTVTASLATERLADFLQIKRGDPILSVRQVSYDQNDVPFEYVRSYYVGERFEFKLSR
ncbi:MULTISPECIES: GntR family transcriptional regulator [Convivina]|uniref:GntR family transcriptional regulator n=2 Tax=Convivina TaxID=1697027 RepID=A0A2U1DBT5_9LACO|nr:MULTISPECIES: GntR family transcriptional regulator [Convivina]SDB88998.1 GntR family transcriptional regulator [Leuconostocaceae bacterium R-53105]PVY85059.1 GntR family transcriptional regulator [Convivina intestini]CAH1852484.1 HTH-type transcriptional repressor NagR [Convivina sp. LMG 32447]CAH1852519.1 HTH-type transcriptional repressor NagR [Convivina sp. LMG 32447]CAH1853555.1 HTH-type transcriptional repressor NagR [Convivina intestini]